MQHSKAGVTRIIPQCHKALGTTTPVELMQTRSRILKVDPIHYRKYNRAPGFSGPVVNEINTDYVFRDWQLTSSEGHPISQLRSGKDIGGPFFTSKWTHVLSEPRDITVVRGGASITTHFRGPVLAAIAGTGESLPSEISGYPAVLKSTPVSTLDGLGTTAIARTIPTNPVADTAQFLGELREGLPSIPGRALLKSGLDPKKFGDEFLNYQFGIRPIIADFKKYAYAAKESDKILKQLARDSGRNVRRRYDFATDSNTTITTKLNTYPVVGPSNSAGTGTLTTEIHDQVDYWFEGAYTYHLPPQGSFARFVSEANKLYGLKPSISTLYELSPWSWAADWFGTTGDVLHNLSAFQSDALVLRYGYLMEHRVRTVTYSIVGRYQSTDGDIAVPAKQVFRCETKRRVQATPYGFGLTFDGFSPSQLAIIAALGLSKAS